MAFTRFDFRPPQPIRRWQAAVLLAADIDEGRSFVAVLRATSGGDDISAEGPWPFSKEFDAPFSYLPAGSAGSLVPLGLWESELYATRLELSIHPFRAKPWMETVASLVILDLDVDPTGARAAEVFAIAPEVVA